MNYYKYYTVLLFLLSGLSQGLTQTSLPLPTAHYPLEAYDKNPTVGYQRFLLIRPWDVSGQARHGQIMGDNAFDNTIQPGKYKGFEAGKWIGEAPNNTTVANFRPCLKKSTENHSKDSYIAIPPPFGDSDISQTGFTFSFWYNPGDSKSDIILMTKRFSVAAVLGNVRIHHSYNGTNQVIDFPIAQGALQLNAWTYVCLVYDHVAKKFYCYQEGHTTYNAMLNSTPNRFEYTNPSMNFAQDLLPVDRICGEKFSGEISNFRFYDSPLSATQVNEVKKIDLHWSNRTHDPNSYIEKGAFMKYTFDGGSMNESMNGLQGTSFGSVSPTTDRFATANNAIHFSGNNAYIETPSFFDATMPVIPYDPSVGGITFSYWVKTDAAHEFPSNPDTLQNLYNNFGGTTKKIFYANNAQNDELFGMQRFKGALGQIRYTQNAQNQLQSWFFWLYDRIAFARQADKWYHVIYVQHPNWQKIYVAKKDDAIDCLCEETDINCWEHCRCAYNYQGIQDLSNATIFGFGNNQGKAIANLDDVRVYHWPLSPQEVKVLHEVESTSPSQSMIAQDEELVPFIEQTVVTTNVIETNEDMRSTLDGKNETGATEFGNVLKVLPNPTTNKLNAVFETAKSGMVTLEIFDVTGRLFYHNTLQLPAGPHNILIDNLNQYMITEGMFYLKVQEADNTQVAPFVVLQN